MKDFLDLDPSLREAHRKKFGGYNDMPPGARKCTVDQFASQFFLWSASVTEHRQIKALDFANSRLWFYPDGAGVMMVEKFVTPDPDMPFDRVREISYYRFALCDHTYGPSVSLNSSGTWRRSTCTKCGYKWEVDSSG